MENYELNYLYHRVKFMLGLGKIREARNMVEREVPYIEDQGQSGNFNLIKLFLKNFKDLLTEESSRKLSRIYVNSKTNEDGLSL